MKLRRMKKVEKQNMANTLTFFGSSGKQRWIGTSPGRDTAQHHRNEPLRGHCGQGCPKTIVG